MSGKHSIPSFYLNPDTSSCWPTSSLLWQEITARSQSTLSWTISQPPSRSNQYSASDHFGLMILYLADGAAAEFLWNDAGRFEGRQEREALVQDDDQTWQTLLWQVASQYLSVSTNLIIISGRSSTGWPGFWSSWGRVAKLRRVRMISRRELSCLRWLHHFHLMKFYSLEQVYALEIQMYTAQKNNKKLKALYDQSLHIKSAIPHPLILGVIRLLSNIYVQMYI